MSSNRSRYCCHLLVGFILIVLSVKLTSAVLFFPRGGSIGLLAAVAIPLDLTYRNVYMAFNFESNYGLPSNDSYNQWIDRWDLDEGFLGIGSDVTPIDGRNDDKLEKRSISTPPRFTRHDFYRAIVSYLGQYGYNGSACLLRTICEVTAAPLDAHNGVLGSIFKILFMPTTSAAEQRLQHVDSLYEATELGTRGLNCADYVAGCAHSMLDMISVML
ncbi:uncharacterized protein [Drosophila virilis]|uniref:Uncharacterized protein, isoform A n=1 Tax=Drosophila virilis TaxID=7244 RepID=B4LC13_DROVI|nr:uncharacterized protein LOC6622248 [Drosophila virilis]EDW69813.1 uncharacterized protein Dvir_GJ11918, isoform A [Drosophila virilis]